MNVAAPNALGQHVLFASSTLLGCTLQVPLVDQATAEKGSQPILAMKDFRLGKQLGFDKFRLYADKPIYRGGAVNATTFFGWDAVPVQTGTIVSVGDKVVLQ